MKESRHALSILHRKSLATYRTYRNDPLAFLNTEHLTFFVEARY